MKKLIKIFPLILICILCAFVFAACNGGGNNAPDKNVILDKCNGEQLEEVYIEKGESYSLGRPTRTGYTFVAWYDANTGGAQLTDNRGESEGRTWSKNDKITVYARWAANDYIIKLDYQGATAGNSKTTLDAVYDEEIETLPVPTKTGYNFLGWYTAISGGAQVCESDGTLTDAYKIYKVPEFTSLTDEANATVLYARWGAASMTINFVTDGSAVASLQRNAGTVIDLMPLTVQNDKLFAGWYLDANRIEEAIFPYTITHNSAGTITLYAKFINATTDYLSFNSINSDKEYRAILSNTAFAGEIVVPDMYFNKPVSQIGSFANGKFTKLTLPHSVMSIAANSFENCTSLNEVNLPQGITVISASLFKGCSALQSVKFPATITNIGNDAFANSGLVEFKISAKVTTIGTGVLSGCIALATITVESGNTAFIAEENVLYRNYGSYYHLVMYAPAKTAVSYDIDPKTQRILDYAFAGAKSLKTITIGGSINTVGAYAFAGCTELYKADINLDRPAGVTPTIGDNAFNGCSRLKVVVVRNTNPVQLGGNNVFAGVSNVFAIYVPTANVNNYTSFARWSAFSGEIFGLSEIFGDFALMEVSGGYAIRQYLGADETVIINPIINGKNIVAINEKAFAYNDHLKNITVPQHVSNIGNQAFAFCTELESVNVMSIEPPILSASAFESTNDAFYIYVDSDPSVVNAYRAATNWSVFADRIFSKN